MRVSERTEPETRTIRIPAANLATGLLGNLVRYVAILGQMPGSCRIFIVAQSVIELSTRVAAIAEENVIVIEATPVGAPLLSEKNLIEPRTSPLRINVKFPNRTSLIAMVAKTVGNCHALG